MKIENHRLLEDDGTPVRFVQSPNRGGPLAARYLVMHYTAGRSAKKSVEWLSNPVSKASAHLVIGRDGSVTQLVPFDRIAWHAGRSEWLGMKGMNAHSLGIEMDNFGVLTQVAGVWKTWFEESVPAAEVIELQHKHGGPVRGWHTYTQAQIDTALAVGATLVDHYGLVDVLGHEDIAPGRKADPGPAFPLESVRSRMLGRRDDSPEVFVTNAKTTVRDGAGAAHAALGRALPAGTKVELLRVEAPWVLVDVVGSGDVQGWVLGRTLVPAPSMPTTTPRRRVRS